MHTAFAILRETLESCAVVLSVLLLAVLIAAAQDDENDPSNPAT